MSKGLVRHRRRTTGMVRRDPVGDRLGARPRKASATSLKRVVFARHSNPWSAWSRWASTPLVAVPFWTRRRRDAVLVAVWMLANPVLFPEPRTDRAWATRAMLGEELWTSRLHRDRAMAVNVAASAAMGTALYGAWRRSGPVAVAGVLAQMSFLLCYWDMMVRVYEGHQSGGEAFVGDRRA
jgi:hypothetical protein